MPHTCVVQGCTNRSNQGAKRGFYSFPKIRVHEGQQTEELSRCRRQSWIARVNRKDFIPSEYSKVCSDHFIEGKPAGLYEKNHPDWAPSLILSSESEAKEGPTKSLQKSRLQQFNRLQERRQKQVQRIVAEAFPDLSSSLPNLAHQDEQTRRVQGSTAKEKSLPALESDPAALATPSSSDKDELFDHMQRQCQLLRTENIQLKEKLEATKLTEDSFRDNNDKVHYLTGLPNFLTLMTVFEFVKDFIPCSSPVLLTKFQKLILVLLKLRLNLPDQFLAYEFRVSAATVSRTFLSVIHVLYVRLKHCIYWPSKEDLRLTMPIAFRRHFGLKVVVIIDCLEIFIERPSDLLASAKTWSTYKHQNTVKFLIGITPHGSISFLSEAWGGQTSDKYITEHSDLLDKLLPGDMVLADRGFNIQDSVGLVCAQVKIPSFMKGREQLPGLEVEESRNIADVKIHVERVIGLVRNEYTILSGVMPIDYLLNASSDDVPAIDKIVTVCCCLTNMCESVVPFD